MINAGEITLNDWELSLCTVNVFLFYYELDYISRRTLILENRKKDQSCNVIQQIKLENVLRQVIK